MGGSSERGWGPLAGCVEVQVADASGDRISAIKLTLTATQTIRSPKSASADAPSALDRMALNPEETKTKEVTLLHVEQILFEPVKTDANRDANLLPQGRHVYPFRIELPIVGNKDKKNPPLLPPSCVVEPLLLGPGDAKMRQSSSGIFGRNKANGKEQGRPAWASVKYQLKLTVQRPGLLKKNLRSYAPFVYLPSPHASLTTLLLQRRAIGAQMAAIVLQRQGDGCQPIETPDEWKQRPIAFSMSPNGPQKLEPEKKGGFLSSIFSGSKKQPSIHLNESWNFSMPMSARSSFPLRSAIPFIVRCTTNKPIDLSVGSPLAFRLYRRVRLLTGKKQKAIAMQQEPVAEAALRYAVESRGVFRLNGLISLPPNCVPNFELNNLSLDYYVAVVRVLDGAVIHKEFVNLACPPPIEPKTAYGPFPSGLAWRTAQVEAPLLPDSPLTLEESPPLAPRSFASSSAWSPAPSTRQRPSISSIASSSSSSFHTPSRRPSAAPSAISYRSSSTDSAHYASAASSLSHANVGPTPASVTMGLAGMANPPPASSAGASGFGYTHFPGNLDPVREQGRILPAGRTASTASSMELAPRRGSQGIGLASGAEASETASITSSRRRGRYSSRGADPMSEASSARSSVDLNQRRDPTLHVHHHEKAPLTSMSREDSQATTRMSSSELGSGRHGLYVTNAEELPGISPTAAASTREHANALVGRPSKSSESRGKRAESERRVGSTSRDHSNNLSNPREGSSRDSTTFSAAPPAQARRADRPLPVTPAAPPQAVEPVYLPAPTPTPAPSSQQATPIDPSLLLSNDDLMYGEDMELDLPPSYFEAVYGAEEEEEDA